MSPGIRAELERAAIKASEALDEARQVLANLTDPDQRRVQSLRIQALAVERDRCNTAFFSTAR